jgi:hypothetical protein
MSDKQTGAAFISALTTEHFVLQTAASATVADAAARSSLYVFSLSSSLVAVGFASRSHEVFVPFIAIVLPAIFMLGPFTVMRLVDTALENMRCMVGIARIRRYDRTLSPQAATLFSARHGRWPEGQSDPVVAGVGVALLAGERLGPDQTGLAMSLGVALAGGLTAAFVAYERWRFRVFDRADPSEPQERQ